MNKFSKLDTKLEEKLERFSQHIAKNFFYQLIVAGVLMAVMSGMYLVIKAQLDKRYEIKNEDFKWVYQIDDIVEEKGKLVISGWGFELEEDAVSGNCEIILHDIITKEGYYPKMRYNERTDVNNYFLCEYDYTQSGFVAEISIKKLDLDNEIYEILLRPNNEKKVYSTGVYYSNGKMTYIDPSVFVDLDTKGTDLETITEDGRLRVYRPDVGMYVYQYEGAFYWIADENYEFIDGDQYVQFQMQTTQIANLPEDRLKNNWLWSNLSFDFCEKELNEWNTGKYRVAKCELPKEYSMTTTWTGFYDQGWVWRNDFKPWYDFNE